MLRVSVLLGLLAAASAISLEKKNAEKTLGCASITCPDDPADLTKIMEMASGDTRTFYIGCCSGLDPTQPPQDTVGPVVPKYYDDTALTVGVSCPGCPCAGSKDCGLSGNPAPPVPKRILADPIQGITPNK